MSNQSFKTYEKIDKPRISLGILLLIALLLSTVVLAINQKYSSAYSDQVDNITQVIAIGLLLLFLFKLFNSQFEKQKLGGKMSGDLILLFQQIAIGERIIPLKEIKKLEIQIEDYEGRREFLLSNTTVPKISHGFNNLLKIHLSSGEKININFEQKFENQFSRVNKDVLVEYYKEEKLSLLNLLEILQIREYEDIQRFKKTIANTV